MIVASVGLKTAGSSYLRMLWTLSFIPEKDV